MSDEILRRITTPAPAWDRDALTEIPWPTALEPHLVTRNPASATAPLPEADVLIVTYTAAEGHALADTLTPGFDTTRWNTYRDGWPELKALIEGDKAPSLESNRAGLWTVITIGQTRVVLFKSDLHPATDGAKLPMAALWRQMIEQVKPRLVITTGTAGGVGADTQLGDVIVTQSVRWDCKDTFAKATFATTVEADHTPYPSSELATLAPLLAVNADKIPDRHGPITVITDATTITTDFFAFDDASDSYGLRAYEPTARAVEMDDAALGVALTGHTFPNPTPTWVSVRNASDPQMAGGNLATEKKQASDIYEKYGYYTTIGSAIVSWAIAASL